MALALLPGTLYAQEQEQVNVAVKIVEFQTGKGVETGFSAYFLQRDKPRPYGRVSSGNGSITSADITFPTRTSAGITVFLDRLTSQYGDFEVVLQGLVDANRAFILSRPKALVPVGSAVDTIIETTQEIPYENTIVVGATITQITSFRSTGVSLKVKALRIVDDDGDIKTTHDTFIQLSIDTEVNEEGQRITVALDDLVAGAASPFDSTSNAIVVPEFISRSIQTTVWIQHGQVLVLGGLYRNTKNKNLATLPWLTQTEDFITGAVQRVAPFAPTINPISMGIGNNSTEEGRRELVFLLRAERWRPAFTVADQFGFTEDYEEEVKEKLTPGDVIGGVIEGIGAIPKGVASGLDEISGSKKDDVADSLGGKAE